MTEATSKTTSKAQAAGNGKAAQDFIAKSQEAATSDRAEPANDAQEDEGSDGGNDRPRRGNDAGRESPYL